MSREFNFAKSQAPYFASIKFRDFDECTSEILRAAASKYQKSLVSRDILNFLIFCLNDPFGELFLKITLESSALETRRRPLEMEKNCAYSTRSYTNVGYVIHFSLLQVNIQRLHFVKA